MAGPYRDDTWMILAYCAALALAWAWCSMASGHVGFRVLIVVDSVLVVPFVSVILSVDHPTWWEVVTCAAGAAVLLAAGLRARSQRTGAPTVAQA